MKIILKDKSNSKNKLVYFENILLNDIKIKKKKNCFSQTVSENERKKNGLSQLEFSVCQQGQQECSQRWYRHICLPRGVICRSRSRSTRQQIRRK